MRNLSTGKVAALFDSTNPDWAPFLKMRPDAAVPHNTKADPGRFQRVQQRHRKLQEIAQNQQDLIQDENIDVENMCNVQRTAEDVAADLEVVILERDTLRQKKDSLQLRVDIPKENKKYKEHFAFDEGSTSIDNRKTHFYTGLPTFTLFMAVFNLCKDHVPNYHRNVLIPFQESMVDMMRLGFNLLMEDLAFRFGINVSLLLICSTAFILVIYHVSFCFINVQRTAEDVAADLEVVILERDTLRQKKDSRQLRVDILKENKKYKEHFAFDEESTSIDNRKTHFYTGLPTFTLFMAVFNLCKDHVPNYHRNVLSPFQESMVDMMRLRLNLLMEDLAFRFGVTQSTISIIITRWLDVVALRMKSFIVWPERETLIKTMPECFKKSFGTSVTLIIDCFELFIETPFNRRCDLNSI
ncbi:Ferrous iron permease EfeU [Frankliniella fusca]|uniref:Ferrous iron permease EfeU n=1 Tax=Frankliniella fusca TaxID=407009 RepID=A0AAE1HB76_9NEOP|nr:Ferrous iron permease EfeU [Frankliniella fusca]